MAGEQQPSIEHLLNGQTPASARGGGTPGGSPPSPHHRHSGHGRHGGAPSGGQGGAPSGGQGGAPSGGQGGAPPGGRGGGGSGSITYTDSALLRFAQTSDDRATSFNQAYGQAQHIQVSRDAFGYMFGAMVYSSYQEQAQSVGQGLQLAAAAMSSIASSIRLSVSRIDQDNQSIVQSLPKG